MLIKMPLYLKKSVERVKGHTRAGVQVHPYVRTGKETKPAAKKKMGLRATFKQMEAINQTIESNMGYLVYMGKEIAATHGLPVTFIEGQPVGDLADLVSEGKHGMIIGGMEAIKHDKSGDLRLMQMKTRAKQRMRGLAKQFMGEVRLPRDVIKHLAIIGSAKEKFSKVNEGEQPSNADLADMIILYKRTTEGGKIELDYEQRLARIEALEGYRGAQMVEDFNIQPYVDEEDISFWTKWTREERDLRRETHAVLKRMIEDKSLTKEQQNVLFLRFYVDKPELSHGLGVRTFETIAKRVDEMRGIKKLKVRKKVGDTFRFKPSRKVQTVKYVRVARKVRKPGESKFYKKKVMGHKYVPYKSAVSGKIVGVGAKSFTVQRAGQERVHTINGKPPFKDIRTGAMDVFRVYESGIAAILKHPSAPDELKIALAKLQKSMFVVLTLTKTMQVSP